MFPFIRILNFFRSLIEHHIIMSRLSKTLSDKKDLSFDFQSSSRWKLIQWDDLPKCRFETKMCETIRQTYRPRFPREVLLVVGGWSGNAPTASSEAFDPATRKWNDTKAVFPAFLKVWSELDVLLLTRTHLLYYIYSTVPWWFSIEAPRHTGVR